MVYQKFIPEGWNEKITHNEDTNEFQGLVKHVDKDLNLHVDFSEGFGIVPRKEVDILAMEEDGNPKPQISLNKINRFIQFKVIDKDEDGKYILSRKKLQQEAKDYFNEDLNKGDVLKGIVTNIRPYGAFVEIGAGVVGLLHIEDISVSRIKSPEERFKVGDKINVMVKDKSSGKIELTYKELLGSWEDNIKDFNEKEVYEGIVRNIDNNKKGVFIELRPNLVGMAEYDENLTYGQKVNAFIKKIDSDKKKIKLIIK